MKYFILLILFTTACLSASAQWYKGRLWHEHLPLIATPKMHSIDRLKMAMLKRKAVIRKIGPHKLAISDYQLELAEANVIKTAQHNMRYRVYNSASYNFSELAKLYTQQNRYSEAKWYLLQSNEISRRQNDDKHTIANLTDLAMLKASMGDFIMAQDDLLEAREIASENARFVDLIEIEKKLKAIQRNRFLTPKTGLRYADAAEDDNMPAKATY